VQKWLARHPRWTFRFTPTSASWLNAVEGFFAKLTKRRLKRGVFLSVVDLQAAINRFVVEHNAKPKPVKWTANPDKIIAAVRREHQVLGSRVAWRCWPQCPESNLPYDVLLGAAAHAVPLLTEQKREAGLLVSNLEDKARAVGTIFHAVYK
jgi:hypothetical protein